MEKITRELYVTKKIRMPPISVVYASAVPILMKLMDYTIPPGASAAVISTQAGSDNVYQAACSVSGNFVEFTPQPGFFAVGANELQLEINNSIIGHPIVVDCDIRLKDKAGGDTTTDPETVASFTARAEAAAAIAENYADVAKWSAAGVYTGDDLSAKFSSEIGGADVWAWLKSRIGSGNFDDIRVGDYINVTCKNGTVLQQQIAGINTYRGYGDPEIGNHVDFISRNLWPVSHTVNPVLWNNGFSGAQCPFVASDLYLWLNSLAGTVAADTAAPPDTALASVDYTNDGIWVQLPDSLKAVISDKVFYAPRRYSSSGVLSKDTGGEIISLGKLWLPMEMEVYGTAIFGSSGYGICGGVQYPIFSNRQAMVKRYGDNEWRSGWWLASAADGKTTSFCGVSSMGVAVSSNATSSGTRVPVCFRITG